MKKNSRLHNVIENDRLLITAEASSLIIYDLKKLLENYFNIEGEVELLVNDDKNCYQILVKAKASNIKNFSIIKN